MSQLERTIKDLIIFYVKENYNKYLEENNITFVDEVKLKKVIGELYDSKKTHLKQFLKDSLKELLKDGYPGDLVVNNLCYEIFQDDELCKNRVCVEIIVHQNQENNL